MVETARVLKTRAAVIKIADRYDVLADKREEEENLGGTVEDE